jgi:hypothetical protein
MADAGFEAFLWSITMQESGGNYRAVGPPTPYGRAYGRYQVLAPNVGPWTAKYYGKRLTPQQFLNNPAAQDAVVRGVLGGYYRKYGARGAAAMWYSGQPNPNKTYGNPPVYQYVNSVVSRMGSYRGQKIGVGASGGGGYTSGGPVKVALSREELMEQYGLSASLINSSKELRSLFNKAVAGSWSAARFQAALKNSKWWKNQSSTLRKYLTTKYTDPATWKQQQSAATYAVNQLAVAVGLGNQIKGGKASKLLKDAVYKKTALGWTDARIKDWMGTKVSVHSGGMWGEAGEAFDEMHEIAYLNGMKYSTSWYAKRAKDVVSGRTTMQNVEETIRRQAAARYAPYAEQIRAGQNVLDLAAPYIKSVSQLLELPESDVDLNEKLVYNAMSGGHGGANFPLWEFEKAVKNDPRWRKTNNARESMFTVAHKILQDFGVSY